MRVIKPKRIMEFAHRHPDAESNLKAWLVLTKKARWSHLAETRATFPHADEVRVSSGRTVTIFNVKGTAYRLITAIHYDSGMVFVLRFMTHAEYGKNRWKAEL